MRRVIGPVVTTGVALVVAGVVVANPIIAPRSDVQIPAVQLSAGSDPTGVSMLDPSFLDAIAPAPPEPVNPFAVLKQLISSLAADATFIGKNAIVDAFVAGVTAVSEPELTAASFPYVPTSPVDLPDAAGVAALIPGLDPAFAPPLDLRAIPAGATEFINTLAPAVQSVVTSLAADAHFVTGELIAAAYAAGAVVASEPALIADTLTALVHGDIDEALQNVVKVVTTSLGPTTMIVDALRAVIENHLPRVPLVFSMVPELSPGTVSVVAPSESLASIGSTSRPNRRPRVDVVLPVAHGASPVAPAPSPAAAISSAIVRDVVAVGAGGDDSAVWSPKVAPRRVVGATREALAAIGDQVAGASGAKGAASRVRAAQSAPDSN